MKKGWKVFLSILLVCALLGGIAASVVTFYGKTYVRAADTAFTVLQITVDHNDTVSFCIRKSRKDRRLFSEIFGKTDPPDLIIFLCTAVNPLPRSIR